MKKPLLLSILLLLMVGLWACKEDRFHYLEMNITPKQLMMDAPRNTAIGLLQQGRPITDDVVYRLFFKAPFGRKITINITPPEGWGVIFESQTTTLPEGSGISFDGPSEDVTVSIKIKEDPAFVRDPSMPAQGPVLYGKMPIAISILDENGDKIITGKDALTVYGKDQVLLTVGDLTTKWKLDFGDAKPYDPSQPEVDKANQAIINAAINPIPAHLNTPQAKANFRVIEDFHGIGLKGCMIKTGWNIPIQLRVSWTDYILTTNAYGAFFWWPTAVDIPGGVSPGAPAYPGVSGICSATVFDFDTGAVVTDNVKNPILKGDAAKDFNNNSSNSGKSGLNNILAGEGIERVVDVKTATTTWTLSTGVLFPTVGKYIVQFDLVNKLPADTGDTGVYKVGKLRLYVEVSDVLPPL